MSYSYGPPTSPHVYGFGCTIQEEIGGASVKGHYLEVVVVVVGGGVAGVVVFHIG